MSYTVALTTDKQQLHAFLRIDPIWAAYAIGDLEPAHSAWSTWRVAADAAGRLAGLVLLYGRLEPPVLLTVGEPAVVAAILAQMPLPGRVAISARETHLPPLLAHYDFSADRVRPMLRMAVRAERFRPVGPHPSPLPKGEGARLDPRGTEAPDPLPVGEGQGEGLREIEAPDPLPRGEAESRALGLVSDRALAGAVRLRRLGMADVRAIEALIALGGPFAPDAFMPTQVAEGVFFGLEQATRPPGARRRSPTPRAEDGEPAPLLAVAGTHLVASTYGVAALGNVYVHPEQRGRGYGALVSSAVTAELLRRGLLVVLNVDQDNPPAIRLYQQLGFAVHCPFVEGIGRRVNG